MSIHQISSTNHINNNDRDKNEESNLKKNNKIIINDKDDNSRSSSSICSENSHCINNHLNNNNDYLCSKQFPVRNNKNNISNVNNNHDDDDDNDDNNIVKIPNNNNNINEHYHQECNNNSNNNNNNNNNHHHHSCLNNHIKESECSISVNINSNNNQNSNNNNNNTDPMNNNKLSPEYVSLVDNEQKPNDDEEEAEMALNAKLPSINRKHVEIVNSCQIEMSQLRTKSQTIRFSFLALFKACSPRGPMVMKLFSAFFFAISSFLLVVVNKVVLTTFHFPSVLVLGLGQVVATIVILNICRRLNIVKFPYYSREINSKLFPLPFFYLGNLVSGLGSTKLLNLPMLTVLRRFTILMTMIGEFYLLGVNQTLTIKLTVLMMISGAIIAASNDLAFDAAGYLYVLLNDVFSTFNGIYMKKKLDSRDLGKYGILYYNALFIVGPMFLISICVDDWHHCFLEYEHWNSPLFILSFLTSCVMGFILMYSTALCTQHNSALTTTIVGCLKNILVTFIGMYIGGDYIFSIVNFIGLNISMIGSLIYSYVIFIHKPSPSKPSKALPTVKQ